MKAIFSFILLLFVSFSYAQTCSIDYSHNTPGIYPSVFTDGVKGTAYSEEFTILFPSAAAGVNYNSFKISSVELPLGLTWECSNETTDCIYVPSQDPFACIRIYGTPAETGQFVIRISADAVHSDNSESVYTVEADLEVIVSSSSNGVFSFTPTSACETGQIDFSLDNPTSYTPIPNHTTGISHSWDFGNGSMSNLTTPATQTFSNVGQYTVTHTEVLDTVGFKMKSVTIIAVGCEDTYGYGNPDIYIEMYDANNTMVYTTHPTLNDNDLPITIPLDLLLNNPPYQIRVMDDDSDNLWGTNDDNCVKGSGDINAKTAIHLPSVSSFGTTTQLANNDRLSFSYNIDKDTIQKVTTEIITIFGNPTQPSIVADLNSPVTLSTSDLGHVYHWNKDNLRDHSFKGAEIHPEQTGSFSVIAVDENGCYSTSNEEYIEVTGLEELKGLAFNIFPNPSNYLVNIEFTEVVSKAEVLITDLSGRILKQHSIVSQDFVTLDVSKFAKGIYTLTIVNENKQLTTKKLIVK